MKLSVVIPAYNEEENLPRTIKFIDEELSKAGLEHEFVVVDDASTDATLEILKQLASRFPLRYFRNERNMKLGYTLRKGLMQARGEMIFYTDCDLPCLPSVITYAVKIMRVYNCDMVIAYRLDRTGEGFLRRIYSSIYNLLIRFLFGLKVRDVNFACKLIKRRVLQEVELTSDGSFIDAELLIKASRKGFKILQFGADYFPRIRGKSTLAGFGVILKLLREMVSFRVKLWLGGKS